ncbi:MAG: glycosyltransferase family 39 protein [Dehalococcoidia bacterium]|nr:glycosyltransferase family 39 protein [Dehalococcoidia bacterium]
MVHSIDPSNGIVYSFRPFRHLDNGLDYRQNGKSAKCPVTWIEGPSKGLAAIGSVAAPGLEMSRVETLKSMLAMTLRSYPYVLAALCVMLAVAVVVHVAGAERWLRRLLPPRGFLSAGGFALVVACAAFGVLFYISHNVNQQVPHVPDEVAYVFQAKILASFHLTVPIPRPKEAFDFFYPSMLVDSGGRWASIVLFGHPLALAIGELVRAVWLVPPVLGGLSILLIYRVGRQIHGAQVGVLAAVLLAFSPFFQMTASNLMSHNTAVFYLLACLFLITAKWKRKSLAYGLAGIFFGLFLNTRPLTAVALVPPFGLLFLSDFVVSRGQRLAIIRKSAAFAAAVLVMVGAFYLYSLATTGSLHTGYGANLPLESMVGFGEKNSVARGMLNDQAQLASLLVVLNGWPLYVGLALVLLPFMLGSRSRWDLFLLLAAVFAIAVWTAFESSGLMYGPRYWYEAVPFLMLLAARGLTLLQDRVAYWAHLIGGRAGLAGPPVATSGVLTYGLLLVLLGISVHGWMLGKHFDTPQTDYAPRTISELKGFNGANDRLLRQLADMDLHNALILVKSCPNWQCYGMVFWKNDTDFNGDIVYARDIPQMQKALTPYLGRKMYRADYGQGTIEPFEPFPLRLDSPGA